MHSGSYMHSKHSKGLSDHIWRKFFPSPKKRHKFGNFTVTTDTQNVMKSAQCHGLEVCILQRFWSVFTTLLVLCPPPPPALPLPPGSFWSQPPFNPFIPQVTPNSCLAQLIKGLLPTASCVGQIFCPPPVGWLSQGIIYATGWPDLLLETEDMQLPWVPVGSHPPPGI